MPPAYLNTAKKALRYLALTNQPIKYFDDALKALAEDVDGVFAASIPAVRLLRTADTAYFADGAPDAVIPFPAGTEVNDPTGMHDTVTNNSRITFAEAGWYYIEGRIAMTEGSPAGTRYLTLRSNGANEIAAFGSAANEDGGPTLLQTSTVRRMNAADYVELLGFQQGGGVFVRGIAGSERGGPLLAAAYLGP